MQGKRMLMKTDIFNKNEKNEKRATTLPQQSKREQD